MGNSLIEENAKAWEIVGHRDQEIKKLLEDKVRILEKLVEMHEMFNKQPLFMMNGNPNAFQECKK